MILIISTCLDKLSEFEFVEPLENILKKSQIRFFTKSYLRIDYQDLDKAKKVIICGTALKDFNYLKNINKFNWLKEFKKPVLGICAGMQVIAKIWENRLIKKVRIGQFDVKLVQENNLMAKKEFKSYFLNSKTVKVNELFVVLAKSGNIECMIKHRYKEIYGCLFHPEVLNQEIIINFVNN